MECEEEESVEYPIDEAITQDSLDIIVPSHFEVEIPVEEHSISLHVQLLNIPWVMWSYMFAHQISVYEAKKDAAALQLQFQFCFTQCIAFINMIYLNSRYVIPHDIAEG